MSDIKDVKAGMTVIGADGAPVGTVRAVVDGRIELEPVDGGHHAGHHAEHQHGHGCCSHEGHQHGAHAGHKHYIPGGLVTIVEDDTVRLSATGANALLLDEEADGKPAD